MTQLLYRLCIVQQRLQDIRSCMWNKLIIPYHATTTKPSLHTGVLCGGLSGRAVNTLNSGSGGPGNKPRPSRCFLRQGTYPTLCLPSPRAGLFKAGLRLPRVSVKFEFRFESSKSKISFILSVNRLTIAYSEE